MNISQYLSVPQSKYGSKIILRWLWQIMRGHRLQVFLNALIGLLMVGTSLAQVWAVKHAIDVASHVVTGNIYKAVALMGGLVLGDFLLNITSVWVKNLLGIKAQNQMQQKVLDRILRSEWRGKEALHSADVLNRLELDVSTVITFLTETLPNTLSTLTLFIGAFAYLFMMDKLLALLIVVMIPIFMVVSKLYIGQMRRLTRLVRDSDSKVQTVLQETIQNKMLIKTMESDATMVDRLENTQSELRRRVVKRTMFSVFSNLILNFGFAAGYLIAFLWAAIRMSNHSLSFGGMTAFLQLVSRIQAPARSLTKLVPAIVAVFTAAERLMELEEDPLEEQGTPIQMPSSCGVRFTNVSYAYTEGEGDVLHGLSFDFKPGSCTAVLGETGSGKTTLIRLILALLAPQEGSIEIYSHRKSTHHHPIFSAQHLTPRHRCNLVYVPQGNTLLSGTIRDNLRLGKLNATEDEMYEALHRSCADFVHELPDGLDTKCAEKGGGLSEGQAQRIAIARALLRDRSIMLFDEATSALDPATERQLLQNILASHDKTIIFITHRSAVMQYCDQTLKIEKIIQ
ncbi:ABC transporter ATP-binding protein [Prevotella sp. A2931]|uniref:ABC transporter ATP-binding protein n=1 Tax=Prevotella illustrans TaxID=2800387 RepID=A0ABS3M7D0_9BACT|nr:MULTISPECIES: ABC transporter ATP-binding protein [Prevotella]MBO1364088.1 ABC transporter ATP-binding protein [Prevotella illustrans]PTL27053.1 ABC transporter [Prevotella sp. oral taxon 820]